MAEPIPTLVINVDNEKLKETLSMMERLTAMAERYNNQYGRLANAGGPAGGGAGGAGAAAGGAGGPGAAGGAGGAGGGRGGRGGDQGRFLANVDRLARGINKTFGEVNKTIEKTIGGLKGLFESALKWSVRIALIGGGSLFGYDMMARRASQQAMTAQGLNVPVGQMQAAQNVYGSRISGVSGIMQGLARAQQDIKSPEFVGLRQAGIDPTKGAGENLPKLIQAVGEITRGMKNTGLAYTQVQARGLGSLVSPEVMNQIMGITERGEAPGLARQYETTSTKLALSENVNSSFQKLITIFDTNSDLMANSFKTWVSDLNVPIGKLATTFTDAVAKFLKGPNGKAVFDTIREGLETFSAWISNPGFQKNLGAFTTAVTEIVKAIGKAIIYIGGIIGKTDQKEGETDEQYKTRKQKERADIISADREKWEITGSDVSNFIGNIFSTAADPSAKILNQYLNDEPEQKAQSTKRVNNGSYAQLENKYNLPPGILGVVENVESGGNRFAVSSAGAKGPFQFMPGTAKDLGLLGGEVFDREKASTAAAKYFNTLLKRYDGDVPKALAAYNWGMGNVDKHGLTSLPKETYDYLNKTLPRLGYQDELSRIAQRDNSIPNDSKGRVKVDIEIIQAPGSDITAQLRSGIGAPIVVPY